MIEEERKKQTDILNEAKNDIELLNKKNRELNDAINSYKTDIGQMKRTIDGKDKEIAKMDDKIRILEQENEDRIKQLDKYKSGMTNEMQDMQQSKALTLKLICVFK